MSTSFKPLQDQFEQAVEVAAGRAAQRVARVHRVRLIRWTFLAAMLTTLVIVLLLYFTLIAPAQKRFVRKQAAYNCQLFTGASAAIGDFVKSDAKLRVFQQKNPVQQRLITDLKKVIPVKDIQASLNQNNTQITATIKRWNKDGNTLVNLAGTNCAAHLGG